MTPSNLSSLHNGNRVFIYWIQVGYCALLGCTLCFRSWTFCHLDKWVKCGLDWGRHGGPICRDLYTWRYLIWLEVLRSGSTLKFLINILVGRIRKLILCEFVGSKNNQIIVSFKVNFKMTYFY